MKTVEDLSYELRELEQFATDSWSNLAIVEKVKSVRRTLTEVITGMREAQRPARGRKALAAPPTAAPQENTP